MNQIAMTKLNFCSIFIACTLLVFILCSSPCNAQSNPQINFFMFNKTQFNPAFAGKDNAISATGLYREQWVGLKGAPSTQMLNVDMPAYFFKGGVGLSLSNRMTGAKRTTRLNLHYAYHHAFAFGQIGGGVSAGVVQRAFDGSELTAPQGSYEAGIDHNDNYIPATNQSGFSPGVSIGGYFSRNDFYAGISATNLLESRTTIDTKNGSAQIQSNRNYYFTSGVEIDLLKKVSWKPSVLVKSDFNAMQIDFNSLFIFNDNIYGGLAFRGYSRTSKDALSGMFGFKLGSNFTVGYSYDFSLSQLNKVNSGSHEVMLNYTLPIQDPSEKGKIIYNPRFL